MVFIANIILQIETVGPEGGKALIFLFLFIAILIALGYFIFKNIPIRKQEFSSKIEVKISGHSPLSFSTVKITVKNTGNQTATLNQPVLKFSKIIASKSFRIKSVKPEISFPLTIHPDELKTLEVNLQPFYSFNAQLRSFFIIGVEINYDQKKKASSIHLLQIPKLNLKSAK